MVRPGHTGHTWNDVPGLQVRPLVAGSIDTPTRANLKMNQSDKGRGKMKISMHLINRILAICALLMGIVSIGLRDADKSPLYFLLAFVLWQLK